MIGAAEFDIGAEGDRIIALDERVEQLVDADWDSALKPFGEVVALHHLGEGHLGGEPDKLLRSEAVHPTGVEVDPCPIGIEQLEDLLLVGLGVGVDLFPGQGGTGRVAARWIPDQGGEVPDQEDHFVAQLLKVAHLPDQHGMAQMQIRCRWVEARLDTQRLA